MYLHYLKQNSFLCKKSNHLNKFLKSLIYLKLISNLFPSKKVFEMVDLAFQIFIIVSITQVVLNIKIVLPTT